MLSSCSILHIASTTHYLGLLLETGDLLKKLVNQALLVIGVLTCRDFVATQGGV